MIELVGTQPRRVRSRWFTSAGRRVRDLLRGVLGALFVSVPGDADVEAGLRQRDAGGVTDAGARPCDDGDRRVVLEPLLGKETDPYSRDHSGWKPNSSYARSIAHGVAVPGRGSRAFVCGWYVRTSSSVGTLHSVSAAQTLTT